MLKMNQKAIPNPMELSLFVSVNKNHQNAPLFQKPKNQTPHTKIEGSGQLEGQKTNYPRQNDPVNIKGDHFGLRNGKKEAIGELRGIYRTPQVPSTKKTMFDSHFSKEIREAGDFGNGINSIVGVAHSTLYADRNRKQKELLENSPNRIQNSTKKPNNGVWGQSYETKPINSLQNETNGNFKLFGFSPAMNMTMAIPKMPKNDQNYLEKGFKGIGNNGMLPQIIKTRANSGKQPEPSGYSLAPVTINGFHKTNPEESYRATSIQMGKLKKPDIYERNNNLLEMSNQPMHPNSSPNNSSNFVFLSLPLSSFIIL